MRPPLSSGWSNSVFNQRMCTLRHLRPSESATGGQVARCHCGLALADDVLVVLAVQEDALPHLEVDQRPQAFAVVLAALVARDDLPNDLRVEQIARSGPLAKHEFVNEPAVRPP